MSRRTVEVAGDMSVLPLDKTGAVTSRSRQASGSLPVSSVSERDLTSAAQLSSLTDEVAGSRSVAVPAKERSGIHGRESSTLGVDFVELSTKTRVGGIDYQGNKIRRGTAGTVKTFALQEGGEYPQECERLVQHAADTDGTPLVVAESS